MLHHPDYTSRRGAHLEPPHFLYRHFGFAAKAPPAPPRRMRRKARESLLAAQDACFLTFSLALLFAVLWLIAATVG